MKLNMVRPCAKCPFRGDIPGYLSEERAAEIVEDLLSGASFPCHTTVDYSGEAEDSEDRCNLSPSELERTEHCAGALIFLEFLNQPNQYMRWMERLRGQDGKPFYDRSRLDMQSPVFGDPEDFITHHSIGSGR